MSQALKILIIIGLGALVFGGVFYLWQAKETLPDTELPDTSAQTTTLTIMAPENPEEYRQAMTEFAQEGGDDPAKTWVFNKKEITVPYTDDPIKASANAAAQEFPTGGGPSKTEVIYLKIINGTAYVLMNIDIDGWAGVSVSLAIIHPVVEKTLLEFPEINKVIFDFAPGDSLETIDYNPDESTQ